MDNKHKARTVLIQVGQPGAFVNRLTDQEVTELASIHDNCLKPLESLGEAWRKFWAERAERLDAEAAAKKKAAESDKTSAAQGGGAAGA